jgi:flavin reductase (DIM6/NTAB) family NADH-FMN oxidoreductase RutF
MSDENKEFARAVGHIPSGLFIVCANDEKDKVIDGYLASWIQQVSFDPLLVTVAIKPGRPAYDLIKNKKTFTINVVGDNDKSFMKHFWKGYDPESNPFEEIEHKITENGGVIINGAKSTVECQLVETIQPGDHEVVIAKVINSYVQDEEAKPLTHVRKSGLDY